MRSRIGWILANLFYEKTTALPEISDLAAWRILIAVMEMRFESQLTSKLVDIQTHYDQKGSQTLERFKEWAETLIPALAAERKKQDNELHQKLSEVGKMGPLGVAPISMGAFQARRQADALMTGAPFSAKPYGQK